MDQGIPLILLLSFNREHIIANVAALNEMKRMREHAVFTSQHAIAEGSGNKIVLFNLRSWMLISSNSLQIPR